MGFVVVRVGKVRRRFVRVGRSFSGGPKLRFSLPVARLLCRCWIEHEFFATAATLVEQGSQTQITANVLLVVDIGSCQDTITRLDDTCVHP